MKKNKNEKNNIERLFKIINIKPKNKTLYLKALTHKTFSNENRNYESYEKLEFVGDSILQMFSTIFIYENFNDYDEGTMSIIRANNVSTESLAKIVKDNKINEFLICSNNVDDLKNNNKICSDIFESLLAAIFIDLGFDETKEFLNRLLFKKIKKTIVKEEKLKDPKTRLQEILQPLLKNPIQYISVQKENKWISKAKCLEMIYGQGEGLTKKEAEINAANDALKKYLKK